MFVSVCRTITVSVQPVWPIVLYGRMLLHISMQCRTGTQLSHILSVSVQQPYFVLFCQAGHRKGMFSILCILNNTLMFVF